MSEHHAAEHESTYTGHFAPAEIAAMHEDDKIAAGHIVKLMVAIFILGIGIYSVVAVICAGGA